MQYVVYYEKKKETILGFFPTDISNDLKEIIQSAWNQPVCRAILKYLSKEDQATAPEIKDAIGHSMSTLHENIARLERDGIIKTEMTYVQNKKKIITSNVLFVTKTSKLTRAMAKFFQGLLVDTKSSKKIVSFLDRNAGKSFTVEQIAARTGIDVDDVQIVLDNWESIITRTFEDALKPTPFVKQILYTSTKFKK